MIGKVTKGNGVPKLLWYLWGPGRANEHTDPHLIASWDPEADLLALEPDSTNGRHDVRPLARLLEQPLATQTRLPKRAVWQCSLRLAPEDRALTDAEWDHAARKVMHRTGFAPRDDPDACRWFAMRHGPDHIHLVVTLARQDGQPVTTRNDYYKLGEACRDLEKQYDLRRTNPRDRTGPRRPSRAELEKAQRTGKRITGRDELRAEVRLAAIAANNPDEFFSRLRQRGVLVRPRLSRENPSLITGYSVASPVDRAASGSPVWFGGSKLSADLSWTRLQETWHEGGNAGLSALYDLQARDSRGHEAVEGVHLTIHRLLRRTPGTARAREAQRLERATLTLLLAIASSSGQNHSGWRPLMLADRTARSSTSRAPSSSDLQRLLSATRWALTTDRRDESLRDLLRVAKRLMLEIGAARSAVQERPSERPRKAKRQLSAARMKPPNS